MSSPFSRGVNPSMNYAVQWMLQSGIENSVYTALGPGPGNEVTASWRVYRAVVFPHARIVALEGARIDLHPLLETYLGERVLA